MRASISSISSIFSTNKGVIQTFRKYLTGTTLFKSVVHGFRSVSNNKKGNFMCSGKLLADGKMGKVVVVMRLNKYCRCCLLDPWKY